MDSAPSCLASRSRSHRCPGIIVPVCRTQGKHGLLLPPARGTAVGHLRHARLRRQASAMLRCRPCRHWDRQGSLLCCRPLATSCAHQHLTKAVIDSAKAHLIMRGCADAKFTTRRARLACVSRAFHWFCATHAGCMRQHTQLVVPYERWADYVHGASRCLAWHAGALRAVNVRIEVCPTCTA